MTNKEMFTPGRILRLKTVYPPFKGIQPGEVVIVIGKEDQEYTFRTKFGLVTARFSSNCWEDYIEYE